MLLYVDLNCFSRPFDDQTQERIVRETAAVFSVLKRIEAGTDRLVWSAVLAFENSHHPFPDRRREIARWGLGAGVRIAVDQRVSSRARQLYRMGIAALDAAHLACAEASRCDRFLTCDDRLLRAARTQRLAMVVQNPQEYIEECGHA